MPLSARDLIAKTSSPERTFDICLNGALRSRQLELEAELEAAKESSDSLSNPKVKKIQEQLDELAPQVEEATVAFRFKGISHWRFKEIQRRFPTEEKGAVWDTDAGAATLVSECLMDPKLTPEEVRELLEHGNQRLTDEFVTASMLVCQVGNEIPKSVRGSGRNRASA